MSILQIELPDEEFQIISAEARARGFEDNAQYVRSVLREMRSYKEYAIDHNLTPAQLAQEEKMMEEALSSGEGEVTDDAWWDKLHADVMAKVDAKKQSAI